MGSATEHKSIEALESSVIIWQSHGSRNADLIPEVSAPAWLERIAAGMSVNASILNHRARRLAVAGLSLQRWNNTRSLTYSVSCAFFSTVATEELLKLSYRLLSDAVFAVSVLL